MVPLIARWRPPGPQMPDYRPIIDRLGEQMARGEAILFTGAGFSFGATDRDGQPIPQVRQLKEEIWELIWPGDPVLTSPPLAMLTPPR